MKRVLLVEDNEFLQAYTSLIFAREGIEHEIASRGTDAIEKIFKTDYDLIFLDCQLPDISGYEVAQEVRDREARGHLKRNNIVALTANNMSGDREKCLRAGMDDHLAKPLNIAQLHNTLKKWLH